MKGHAGAIRLIICMAVIDLTASMPLTFYDTRPLREREAIVDHGKICDPEDEDCAVTHDSEPDAMSRFPRAIQGNPQYGRLAHFLRALKVLQFMPRGGSTKRKAVPLSLGDLENMLGGLRYQTTANSNDNRLSTLRFT